METVTVREPRNHGADVLKRVERGASLIVTKNGEPLAEPHPTRRQGPTLDELIEDFRHLPPMDYEAFRHDVDSVVDQSLDTIWDSEA